jgi:uncharacterized membrane protein
MTSTDNTSPTGGSLPLAYASPKDSMTSTDKTSPTGGAWAAILAAAIGCACFAVATDLAEMSKRIHELLTFHTPTGDLSGKSTLGVIGWLLAWGILHARWNGKEIRRPGGITALCVFLILLAMVLIFPEFVERIAFH